MSEQVFTNAQIVLGDAMIRGSVVVREGRIADISEGNSSVAGALDFDGDLLLPGLVELHTDNIERHVTPRPGTQWPIDAAAVNHDREVAAAGITTVFDAISVGEVHERSMRAKLLSELCPAIGRLQSAGALKAQHFLHLRCETSFASLVSMLEPLIDQDGVRLISVMDHTPGQRQFSSLEVYAEYYQGKYGMSDAELQEFIDVRIASHKRYSASNRAAVVSLAHDRGLTLASHDDATLEHVSEAIDDKMVLAEFPTTREAAKASHDGGLAVLMGGPNIVRGGSHSGNVSARDLAEAGQLDIISSDYVPSSLLHGALLLADQVEAITLPEAVAKISRTPARQVGLHDRGEIAEGLRADLLRVNVADTVPIVRDVWREGRKIA